MFYEYVMCLRWDVLKLYCHCNEIHIDLKFYQHDHYGAVAALDLGNVQRFRGTKRFILKALCRQALGVIDVLTAPSPNFRETAHAAVVADF